MRPSKRKSFFQFPNSVLKKVAGIRKSTTTGDINFCSPRLCLPVTSPASKSISPELPHFPSILPLPRSSYTPYAALCSSEFTRGPSRDHKLSPQLSLLIPDSPAMSEEILDSNEHSVPGELCSSSERLQTWLLANENTNGEIRRLFAENDAKILSLQGALRAKETQVQGKCATIREQQAVVEAWEEKITERDKRIWQLEEKLAHKDQELLQEKENRRGIATGLDALLTQAGGRSLLLPGQHCKDSKPTQEEGSDGEALVEHHNKVTASDQGLTRATLTPTALSLLVETLTRVECSTTELMNINGAVLTGRDMSLLRPGRWLNDEVVNVYMAIVSERNEARRSHITLNEGCSENRIEYVPTVKTMNSFFYSNLVRSGSETGCTVYEYRRVSRWTKECDVFSFDMVLIPINEHKHWTLGVVDFRERRIQHLDSLGSSESMEKEEVKPVSLEDGAARST